MMMILYDFYRMTGLSFEGAIIIWMAWVCS